MEKSESPEALQIEKLSVVHSALRDARRSCELAQTGLRASRMAGGGDVLVALSILQEVDNAVMLAYGKLVVERDRLPSATDRVPTTPGRP